MSFFRWLRTNSEHYLVIAAQAEVAKRHGVGGPARQRGFAAFFWMKIFVPIYRILPWPLRHSIMRSMPGSHRKTWEYSMPPSGPAV